MLKRIIQSPYLNLLSGVVLLFTAGKETWESIGEFSIGVHHGVLIFSIVQIMQTLPELMHGLKEIDEAQGA